MVGDGAKRVLLVGGLEHFEQRAAGFFKRQNLDVQRASDHAIAAQMVAEQQFSLCLVEYVDSDDSIRAVIQAARNTKSSSKRAPLVLLSRPEHLDQAEDLLAQGIGRILNPLASPSVLETALQELCVHEPRVPVRLLLRVPGEDIGLKGRQIMQTMNISMSGMLVRCDKAVLVGARFSFSLEAPGLASPITGRAAIARIHQESGQRDQGFGSRFIRFERDGRERLQQFLSSWESPPEP